MKGTPMMLILVLRSCRGFSVLPKAPGTKIHQGSRTWSSTLLFGKVLPRGFNNENIPITDILPEKLLKEIVLEAEERQERREEYETHMLTPPFRVPAPQSSHNQNQVGMVDETAPLDELISKEFMKEIALNAEPPFYANFQSGPTSKQASMVDDTIPIEELLPEEFMKEIALKATNIKGRRGNFNERYIPPFRGPASKTGHSSKQASMVDEEVPVEELMSDEFMAEIDLEAERAALDTARNEGNMI
jgi:hypothetical protein